MAGMTLFLLAAVVYLHTLLNGFVYDDLHQVLEDPRIRSFRGIPEIFSSGVWSFKWGPSSYYRPLMQLSYLLTFQLAGLRAWAFHLVNVLVHALTVVAVFSLAAKVLSQVEHREPTRVGALAAALIYAVHPVLVEPVAWVAAIGDLLMALFFVLACRLYLSALEGSTRCYWATLGCCVLALLAKEPAVTLPAVLLLIDVLWSRERDLRRAAVRSTPFVITTVIYLIIRNVVLGGIAPPGLHGDLGTVECYLTAVHFLGQYLLKELWPFPLNALYEFHPVASPLDWRFVSSVALCAIAAWAVVAFRHDRRVLLGASLFLVPLLPAMYVPGVGEGGIAERYLCLPTSGFALLLGMVWSTGARRIDHTTLTWIALAILTLAVSVVTVSRSFVWRNEESLWTDTVTKSPGSAVAHEFLAYAHFASGRLDRSVEENLIALQLDPRRNNARINLGASYSALGRLEQAATAYYEAIVREPGSFEAHAGLGFVYTEQNRLGEALEEYRIALSINPSHSPSHNGAGVIYGKLGDLRSAEREFAAAVSGDPGNPRYLANLDQVRQAIRTTT